MGPKKNDGLTILRERRPLRRARSLLLVLLLPKEISEELELGRCKTKEQGE
jgi:hypothetical protein